MLRKYRNGGQTVALGANKVAYVEGCCVGGGSEINSGIYHRAPPEILDLWRRQFKVSALTEADLHPHFEACERDRLGVPFAGSGPGGFPQAPPRRLEGWAGSRSRCPAVFAAPRHGGRRRAPVHDPDLRAAPAPGRREAPAPNPHSAPEAAGWQVAAEGRHAAAGALRIEAETVFLCGGAVQTPALLRRSGITRNIGNALQFTLRSRSSPASLNRSTAQTWACRRTRSRNLRPGSVSAARSAHPRTWPWG